MRYLIVLAVFVTSISSCVKDIEIKSLVGKWEVISLYNEGALSPQNELSEYILEFENDSVFTLKLDVNNCGSKYLDLGNNDIRFESIGCTKICCDTDYADKLLMTIYNTMNFEINQNILSLNGKGAIKLRWVEE